MNPDIYIVDITMVATTKVRGNRTESKEYKLNQYPVLLNQDGSVPNKEKEKIFKKVWSKEISKKTFADYSFRILSLKNKKWSSKINYIYEH